MDNDDENDFNVILHSIMYFLGWNI